MASSLPYAKWRAVAERAKGYLVSREAMTLMGAWIAASSDGLLPARRDLKPDRMGAVLPDVWLMDYEVEGGRLRYRLEGENIRARYDHSLVGKYLEDTLDQEARERVLRYFLACVQKPAISIVAGRLYHEWDRPGYGERLLLPLVDSNGLPEGLVGITICKQTFANRPIAEERAKRTTWVLPLDGSEASEEAS